MEPNAVYYLVLGGGAVLVGIVVDAFSTIPWWVVVGLGILGAWAFTWLTALDDMRRPWRSLKILVATVRDPSAASRTRAMAYEIPLYAPTAQWHGTRWLSGGGMSYGGNLLSAARPSVSVTWTASEAEVSARTAMRPMGTTRSGRLPHGIAHQLPTTVDRAATGGVTTDELAQRLRPFALSVDGRRLTGTVLDLPPWGHGWVAEARVTDQFVVELAGKGVEPDGLPLVEVAVEDLPVSPEG